MSFYDTVMPTPNGAECRNKAPDRKLEKGTYCSSSNNLTMACFRVHFKIFLFSFKTCCSLASECNMESLEIFREEHLFSLRAVTLKRAGCLLLGILIT